MARALLIALVVGAMSACLPAHAQEDLPELDGGPPPLQIPRPQPKPSAPATPSASTKLKAEEARLARVAETQKAEQTRLSQQADDLKAERIRLDARAAALAAEERRIAQLRTDQDAAHARQLADLDRQPTPPPASEPASIPDRPAVAPPRSIPPRTNTARSPLRVLVTYDDARRACTRAGMAEARDRNYISARYDSAPHYFEREREVRGLMRMDDRRGYLLVDTVCELDDAGAVQHFELLR